MTQGDQKGMNQTLSRKDSASIQRSARELSQKKSLFYQLGYVALTNVCLIKDGDDDPGDHTIIVFRLFSGIRGCSAMSFSVTQISVRKPNTPFFLCFTSSGNVCRLCCFSIDQIWPVSSNMIAFQRFCCKISGKRDFL